MSADLDRPAIALAIGAHPDDIEFGCGATLAKWAAAGAEVHLLVLTDGSKGTWDEAHDVAALVALRRTEARAAADAIGGGVVVHFGGFVDGELRSDTTERELVCRVIREVRPAVVLGHDPWKRYRLHPDHRHAGWLTVDSVVAARDPHFFPGVGGTHHRPDALLLFEAEAPDHVERVDDSFGVKVEALLRHRSQWRSTMGIAEGATDEAAQRDAFTAQLEQEARTAGQLGSGGLGEAFHLIDAR